MIWLKLMQRIGGGQQLQRTGRYHTGLGVIVYNQGMTLQIAQRKAHRCMLQIRLAAQLLPGFSRLYGLRLERSE